MVELTRASSSGNTEILRSKRAARPSVNNHDNVLRLYFWRSDENNGKLDVSTYSCSISRHISATGFFRTGWQASIHDRSVKRDM